MGFAGIYRVKNRTFLEISLASLDNFGLRSSYLFHNVIPKVFHLSALSIYFSFSLSFLLLLRKLVGVVSSETLL